MMRAASRVGSAAVTACVSTLPSASEKAHFEPQAALPPGLQGARKACPAAWPRDPLQILGRGNGLGEAQALDPGRGRAQEFDGLLDEPHRFVELRQKIGEAARKAGARQFLHGADGEKAELSKKARRLLADAQPLHRQGREQNSIGVPVHNDVAVGVMGERESRAEGWGDGGAGGDAARFEPAEQVFGKRGFAAPEMGASGNIEPEAESQRLAR